MSELAGNEPAEELGSEIELRGFARSAARSIRSLRELQELARLARLENAMYGNRAPGITDEEIKAYIQDR